MRWYSLNGVPRGSKNGSGASIRIRSGVEAACGIAFTRGRPAWRGMESDGKVG